MRPPAPLVVVTLPGRTASACRAEARVAAAAGADVAEVRVDRWARGDWAALGELFPSPVPLLATLRSSAEGGEGPDGGPERERALDALRALPFAFLDLEAARDRPGPEPPPATPGRASARIVRSSHLREATATEELRRLLVAEPAGAAFVKVVLPSTVGDALGRVLPALPAPPAGPCVVHTTGASGPLLRAWSRRLGFPAVFARLPSGSDPGPVEPAQIPVDRLRPYLDADEGAPLFAVVGHPVAHSRSPALHSRWMRAEGRSGLYVALDIASEEELALALGPLASGGFRGLNVTHPWKAATLRVATQVRRAAEECGCANTLTLNGSAVEAENTDLAALLRRFGELVREERWDGEELTVLGSGGAARAAAAAARALGARLRVRARDRARAQAVADRFGGRVDGPGERRPSTLVVQATPVGRSGSGPLDARVAPVLGPKSYLLDLVYAPDDPAMAALAAARGARYEDGWRLLLYQASASYAVFWDAPPPASLIEEAAREGPCAP